METGVFIREQVNGKWGSFDIGDKQLSDEQIAKWLGTKNSTYVRKVVMVLLNRDQNVVEGE